MLINTREEPVPCQLTLKYGRESLNWASSWQPSRSALGQRFPMINLALLLTFIDLARVRSSDCVDGSLSEQLDSIMKKKWDRF